MLGVCCLSALAPPRPFSSTYYLLSIKNRARPIIVIISNQGEMQCRSHSHMHTALSVTTQPHDTLCEPFVLWHIFLAWWVVAGSQSLAYCTLLVIILHLNSITCVFPPPNYDYSVIYRSRIWSLDVVVAFSTQPAGTPSRQ
ncbi:hypothetical protein BJX76DRAFT_337060, partial [Aspergillus varians]